MTKKMVIPWELKADIRIKGWASILKGLMYEIREEYGAAAAMEIYERLCKRDDRVKNLTKSILEIFKIEGNDAETIGMWWNIYWELTGMEGTTLEQSKTINKNRITKCPFKTGYKDLSDWVIPFIDIITKTINPKATFERPIGMCAGDPYCEYVFKIKE
ncbi:MAG: hypothetical protein ACFFCD_07925 [Promethearchaeota archaeon]